MLVIITEQIEMNSSRRLSPICRVTI